ncbi:MAG: putative transporter [Deltaproteobacteria bacterium]|nr:putative transporter [Deltaproteobacteria bacterium]
MLLWIGELLSTQSVANAVLVLSLVAALGLALGSVPVAGISLGIGGVLFAGLAFGYLGFQVDPHILHFVREFGLILFIFTMGMQVGPGFFSSLRRQGLKLNVLAAAIVLLGALLTLGLVLVTGMPMETAVGLYTGATTNTPALGAAQEALLSITPNPAAQPPSVSYAVAYPFGIVGIVLSMLLLRSVFRIDPAAEAKVFAEQQQGRHEALVRLNLRVDNPNLEGLTIQNVPGIKTLGVVISRIRPVGEQEVITAHADSVLHVGDLLLAVGPTEKLAELQVIVGSKSEVDLLQAPGLVTHRQLVVTHSEILGTPVRALDFARRYGVTITRVTRAGVEMTAHPDLALQFGDLLQVVGAEASLDQVAAVVGNETKELNYTRFIGVFVGIAVGVLLGSWPIHFRAIPAPVKLGLAGGPLLAALLFSNLGRLGAIVFYIPNNANLAFRELGISLFLACVGLSAGQQFVEVLLHGDGLYWIVYAGIINLVPLLCVGIAARILLQANYAALCGLLAGSMTDPPALAFSHTLTGSEASSVVYAAVYPLTMLLRVVSAQLLVLVWLGSS